MRLILFVVMGLLLINICSCNQHQAQVENLRQVFDSIDSASLSGIDQEILASMDSVWLKWELFSQTGDSSILYQAININERLLNTDTSTNGFKHHVEMRKILYTLTNNPKEVLLSSLYPPINSNHIHKSFYKVLKRMLVSSGPNSVKDELENIIHGCDSLLEDSIDYNVIIWKADAQLLLDRYDDACITLDNAYRYAREQDNSFMAFQLEGHKKNLKEFKQVVDDIISQNK